MSSNIFRNAPACKTLGVLTLQQDCELQVQRWGNKVFPDSMQGLPLPVNYMQLWKSFPTEFLIISQNNMKKIKQ
jgi:hypothetical protein